jgi:tRNA(Ile)-lysidine synthase
VIATIRAHDMAARGDLVLVAVSGGPDSTALLHALAQLQTVLGIRLRAAHVHHGIRGKEADLDAAAARALARRLGIPFNLRRVDAPAHARASGLSLETAARELRYAALAAIARRCRADRIATGHTMDDQAETVLLNLLRGAGPRGLAGIPPVRDRIIRPLLDLRRADVTRYCQANGLVYRVDRSNVDLSHTRNRLRHEIIPALERVQPAIVPQLARLAAIMRAEDEFMSKQAEAAFPAVGKASEQQIALRLDAFAALAPALQRRLVRQAVAKVKGDELDLELERVEAVVRLALSGRTAAVVELPGGLQARRSYHELLIGQATPAAAQASQSNKPIRGQWELPVPGEVCIAELGVRLVARLSRSRKLPAKPTAALLDADTIQAPLLVRGRRPGDRFRPSGMRAAVKLQDFFVNRKVPRAERSRVPLVLSEGEIVWVVGHRVSDGAKVTGKTRRTLRLEVRKLTRRGRDAPADGPSWG